MIKHIISMKFTDPSVAPMIAERLNALLGVVPTLRSMEVGLDILHSGRSYHLVLIATFDSLEGLAAYDQHPEHLKVRELISKYKEGSVAVDFEYKP